MSRIRNSKRQWTSHVIPTLTIGYIIGLSYLTLAPDPWSIFGSRGRSAEQTFDSTLADYVQHAIVYSMLGVLLAATCKVSNRSLPLLFVFGVCHAVGSESLQHWIPPRSCSVADGFANIVGLCTGWFLVKILVSVGCSSQRRSEGR